MPGPTIRLTFAGDSKDLEKTVDRVGSSVDGMAKGISKSSVALGAAGAAAGSMLVDAFTRSLDFGSAQAELAAAVGDPAKSAEYGKVAGQLYADAYGESIRDVNAAVEAVGASLQGLGADGLQQASAHALDFAKVFKVDVAESAKTVGILIKTGLATDAENGFDLITRAAQKVPVALRQDVFDAVNEYGSVFSDLGFTGDQTFSILTNAAQRGGIALDKVGDVIKEMSLKATDGSKSTVDAFKSIGLNSDEMSNKLLAGGDQSREAITQIAGGLLSIQDPSERARQSIALFGTPLEDLGVNKIPDFLQSLADGTEGMGEVTGAAQRMGETLNDTAANKLESAKRGFQDWTNSMVEANGPLGDIATAVVGFGPDVLSMAGSLALVLTAMQSLGLFTPIVTAAQWLWNAAMTANPIGLIIVAIAALVAAIVWIATQTTWFQDLWTVVWDGIVGAFNWAKDTIAGGINWLSGVVSSVAGAISGAFSGIGDGIKSAFRGAFNFVADAWNNTVGSLSWQVPSWVPGIGGSNFSAPKLPRFHTGGLVPGAPGSEMLAVLQAGERVTSANQVNQETGGTVVFGSDGSKVGDAVLALVEATARKQGRALVRA